MKNFILVLSVLFFLGTISYSQENVIRKENSKMMECCAMKKGKMVCIKDGKEVPMAHEMQMNGMTVMPDGRCKMKDGKMMKLKEGQCCDKKGQIHSDCMN
jgi:hypothetical protein